MVAQTLENGFYDDFDGASLDPAFWGSATAGTGAVTVANSVVTVDSPAVGDAAFVYALNPIVINQSSIFRICVRAVTPDAIPDLIGISRDQTVPTTGDEATIQNVLLCGVSFQTASPYHAFTRYIGDDLAGASGFEDFETLNGGDSIGLLPNWTVDFGDAQCRNDGSFGKVFDPRSQTNFRSGYARIDDDMAGVDQWMSFKLPNWNSNQSIGPGFRLPATATGPRYMVRIRNSDQQIEWAMEDMAANGSGSFNLIERSGTTYTPNGGDYVGFEVTGTGASTVVRFWDFGPSAPSSDGPSAWGAATWTSTADPGANAVDTGVNLAMSYYYPSSGGQYIDDVAWGPYPAVSGPSFQTHNLNTDREPRTGATPDTYVLTVEVDGANRKIRGSVNHADVVSWNDPDKGLALSYLGDWQDIDPSFIGPNMYLYFGKRYTDVYSGNWEIEWAYHEKVDTIIDGWVNSNARSDPAYYYDLYKVIGYGTHWMPADVGAAAIAIPLSDGPPGYDQGYRGKFIGLDEDNTYYMFLESSATAFFGDAVMQIHTATDPNGPWTYQTFLDPSVLVGAGYVAMNHPWIEKRDESPAYYMLCSSTQSTFNPRIFLFSSNSLTGGWTKYTGAGTDGAVIEASGTGWRQNGVNEITVVWDEAAGNHKALISGYHNNDGWSVGMLESNDNWLSWSEPAGVTNPIIAIENVRSDVLNIGSGTILVADGSEWTPGAAVCIANSTHTQPDYSRIKSISTNTLTLYHVMSGITTGHDIEQAGSGSVSALTLYWEENKSQWVLLATLFQPFIRSGGATGPSEMCGRYTAPALTGPWTIDHTHTLNLAPGNSASGADQSNENLRPAINLAPRSTAVAPGIILGM